MKEVTITGIDLAKSAFQLHGASASGEPVFRKKLSRAQVLKFLGTLPSCLVAIEACASSRCWGREITKLGYEVRWRAPIGWSGLIASASLASGPLVRCFPAWVGGSPERCAA